MPNNEPNFGRFSEDSEANAEKYYADGIPCHVLGLKIAKSAVEFEDSVAEYLHCQCMAVKQLICSEQDEKIIPILRSFKENLEQISCIETQLTDKLNNGLCLSNCDTYEE